MQAIIMAAGFGSRIHKITKESPKSFLEINGEKLISRAVRLLRARGIEEIVIVTGYRAGDFHNLLGDSVSYRHNPLYFCTNVLSSFASGMDFLSEDFIFLHADTIFAPDILDDLLASDLGDLVLPVDFKECGKEEMKVLTSDGDITRIDKQIELFRADGEFIGLARVSASALPDLRDAVVHELKVNKRLDEYFECAIQRLIDQGRAVSAMSVKGQPWVEIDFPEDFKLACELFGDKDL